MEEVWKDINQTSIEETNPRIARGLFEDILNRAPKIPQTQSEKESDEQQADAEDDSKDEIFKKELLMNSVVSTPGFMASLNSPFEALATNTVNASASPASSLLNPSCFPIIANHSKRPRPDFHHDFIDGDSGVDRRHKRMIKNRESAARSRARRQAYTSELEREHAELKEENAMLRKQQEQLLLPDPVQVQRKSNHNRSLTAPF